jgi:uncharacterized sulfatase
VLEVLDRKQLWDQTIVIFLGDNGYHLGERQWWNKNTLYEPSCRVPLLVSAPGYRPGVAAGIVELVDLYPTLIDLCHLTAPHTLAGSSMRPLLQNPGGPGKRFAHTMVSRGPQSRGDSLRTRRWRYIEWSDGTRELYDYEREPGEWHNVAGNPGHESTVNELHEALDSFRPQGP